jgi:hypothetical protein
MTDIDIAIATYRAELTDLARRDLDEIEDHFRTLVDELRAAGVPAVHIVAEAKRRLGEPEALAREHARVRSAYGTPLSAVRTWSALALFAAVLVQGAVTLVARDGLASFVGVQLVLGCVLAAALGARLPWARPIVLGTMAVLAIPMLLAARPWLACYAGIVVFLMPWRRRELSALGYALVLEVWAFGAACYALGFEISSPDGVRHLSSAAEIAFCAAIAAAAGGVVRAKWSGLASAVSTVALVATFAELAPLHMRAGGYHVVVLGLVATGVVAAAAGAALAWRHARSPLGSLRGVLSR